MAFLSWHPRYSVGHAALDQQHQKLFELVNLFDDVIQMNMQGELRQILDQLISHTVDHFAFEEELLQAAGFPRFQDHKKMHDELIRQIEERQAKMQAGGNLSTKAVVRFLADWLTYHILREDMEYRPYLNTQGSSPVR